VLDKIPKVPAVPNAGELAAKAESATVKPSKNETVLTKIIIFT